ncbi:MAG: DHH family phosphoesterase [candidate division WOR-3 bacterium]
MIPYQIKPVDEAEVKRLSAAFGISEILARLLVLRGVKEWEEVQMWLKPDVSQLYPPELLPDFDAAAERLVRAIEKRERVLIWGHDDLDGITAAAILGKVLSALQAAVDYHIPTRGRDKHGLDARVLETLPEARKPNLIVTVDCGITNNKDIEILQGQGIDVVVTDHHEVTQPLPAAEAVVDPKRDDGDYPYRELTGAGVALKLAMGIAKQRLGVDTGGFFSAQPELLALSALGTIADRAPLNGENRIIVTVGLRALQDTRLPALRAVLNEVNFIRGRLTLSQFLGELLPLFAAAEGVEAVKMFLDADEVKARMWVKGLVERRNAWQKEAESTLRIAQENVRLGDGILFVQHQNLSLRALGFTAARLKERYQVPAVVIGWRGDIWVGECRGMPGVDLMELLRALRGYFIDFGGHKQAAGFSIEDAKVGDFIRAAERFAHENFAGRIVRENPLLADAFLPFSRFDPGVRVLAPFGEGNPQPVFVSEKTALVKDDVGFVPETRPDLVIEPFRFASQIEDGVKYFFLYTVDDLGRLTIINTVKEEV